MHPEVNTILQILGAYAFAVGILECVQHDTIVTPQEGGILFLTTHTTTIFDDVALT